MTVDGFNPKAGSKHAHVVDASLAYIECEIGQVVIHLLKQAMNMKGLDNQLNGILINEVPKILANIASETKHAIKIENTFDATHQTVIPMKLIVTSSKKTYSGRV